MPDATDEELGLDPEVMETLDPGIRNELRQSRQLRRDNGRLEAEAAQARREAAFAKAGIPDTPLGQMFGKAYEGPTDDPTAIKASFEALGVPLTSTSAGTPAQPDPAQQGATAEELAAQKALSELGSGADLGGDVDFAEAVRSAPDQKAVMELLATAPEGATDSAGRRIGMPVIE